MAPRRVASAAPAREAPKTDMQIIAQNFNNIELPDHLRLPFAKRLLNESHRTSDMPSLLALLPELKIKIFGYVVVEEDPIEIRPSPHRYPALSHRYPAIFETCHEIRNAAVPIYFENNRFELCVQDYDMEPFRSSYARMFKYKTGSILVATEGSPNWDNLFKWAMSARRGQCPRLNEHGRENFKVIGGMLSTFVKAPYTLSAQELEELANGFRHLMAQIDPRWGN